MVLGEQGHREQNSGSYGKLLNKKKVLFSEEEKAENAHISNEKSNEVSGESSKNTKAVVHVNIPLKCHHSSCLFRY
jgi:hypothetical protein